MAGLLTVSARLKDRRGRSTVIARPAGGTGMGANESRTAFRRTVGSPLPPRRRFIRRERIGEAGAGARTPMSDAADGRSGSSIVKDETPKVPGGPACPSPAGHRHLPVHDRAPLREPRALDQGAWTQALADNRMILLAAQKKQDEEDPGPDDIFTVGTVALIMRMLKLPDGRIRVLVQGVGRAPHHVLRGGPALPPGADRADHEPEPTDEGRPRGRGPDAQRQGRPREVGEPRQAHLARGHRHRHQHGGAGPAGRPHRQQPGPQGRRRAGDPGGQSTPWSGCARSTSSWPRSSRS